MRKQRAERRPKNPHEAAFYDKAIAAGWKVSKRGWPDFFCWKDGEFIVVEVKPKRSRRLKSEQIRIMSMLSAYGVKCYRWDSNGFQRITKESPLAGVTGRDKA